tara:strand:- start:429 stop:941 length:513 start_codon:yes stop_codon:yes gene_type:complete
MNKLYDIIKPEIKEYIKLLKESSVSNNAGWSAAHPDDGPAVYYGDVNDYHNKVKDMAELMGYKIINHMVKNDPDFHYEYRKNIVPVVSFGKSEKWKKHILKVGSQAGYEVMRGISKKFGLESDSLDAGTPEFYKQKSPGDTRVSDKHLNEFINNKLYSSYFHRRVFNNEK